MLNSAHRLHRQAEKAARKGRIEEAIAFHKEAADVLNQLLQTILDDKVAESVRLQATLHEKERLILRHQKRRAEQVSRDLKSIRARMASDGGRGNLQQSIYKKFEETESLLDQLRIQEEQEVASSLQLKSQVSVRPPSASSEVVGAASKKPKDDKVIIEELQVANCHLRKMVDSLFFELNVCQRDNLELKARIKRLEAEMNLEQEQICQEEEVVEERRVVKEDCDQLLPPLPPLEMPTFDFDKRHES